MNSKVVIIVVAAVVAVALGAGGFLLGMRIGGGQQAATATGTTGGPGALRGPGTGGPGAGFSRGPGGRSGMPQGGFREGPGGSAFVAGKVIDKDKDSITVSLPNGGSKNVYLSKSTRFEKLTSGSVADVSVGETVTAAGNTGSDGNITARNVTIVKK